MAKRSRVIHRADVGRRRAGAPVVWAVGPWDLGEFAVVRGEIEGSQQWRVLPRLSDAVEEIRATSVPPELVLLAQARPGVDEQVLVDRLLAAAPLVRVIVVAGSWCEGELRTGKPLVGVQRIYWHELPGWWRRGLVAWSAGLAPHWAGPIEPAAPSPSTVGQVGGILVAIDAIDFATFEALEAALRPQGWACVWTPRGARRLRTPRQACGTAGSLNPASPKRSPRFVGSSSGSRRPWWRWWISPARSTGRRCERVVRRRCWGSRTH